jgi:pimeloyl-ACP methyl ester carboxylesterase
VAAQRLNVVTAGDGIPVVLLHGLTATHRYVVMGSKHLERSGHRVVAYDARGHGASDPAPVPGAYRYDDLLADLLAVLDAEGLDRAVLAGASMGAHTALKTAIEAPDRVAGLVVITPAYDPVAHGDAVSLERWDALSDGLRRGPRRRADGRRRRPRRGRPGPPAGRRGALRRGDPRRGADRRGGGEVAAGLAGRPAVAGHRRAGGAFEVVRRGASHVARVDCGS